jgi:uncharacterized protein YcbK (DUF882 family)
VTPAAASAARYLRAVGVVVAGLAAAAAAISLWPAPARAADKLANLAAKKQAPVPSRAEKDKLEARLRKLVGKPAPAVINLQNIWTNEDLVLDAKPGAAVDSGTFDRFLRCHFTNEPTHMDQRLQAVLLGAALRFKTERIEIVSGYRAPKFNLMLRKHGHEVARDSQHSYGHAVDFRLPGVPTRRVLGFVRSLHLGGAGYYPESEFVHADTGPIRTWAGR